MSGGLNLQQARQPGDGPRLAPLLSFPDEEALWRAIHEIEDHDLVYKLLKRTSGDMSYPDIARELAVMLNVNAEHLTETSFLNVQDERLLRLANGCWALKEFVAPSPPDLPQPPPPPTPRPTAEALKDPRTTVPHNRWVWYFLAALIAVVTLVWILATK